MKLLIWDWDDTLFPTSYLKTDKTPLTPDHTNKLTNLIVELLDLSYTIADRVYIVTSSDEGWINYCLDRYLPDFPKNKLPTIFPRTPILDSWKWKAICFRSLVGPEISQLISIGDSEDERYAAWNHAPKLNTGCKIIKTLKVASTPGIEAIMMQHQYLKTMLPLVVNHHESVDLVF